MAESGLQSAVVLLRHTLPDGSWHCDWMLERPADAAERRLITFRTHARVDSPAVVGFLAERLDDHRAAYLSYQGEVSGGQGTVRRLASGVCVLAEESATALQATVRWHDGEIRRCRGLRQADGLWIFAIG